jgi:hypothetical protein
MKNDDERMDNLIDRALVRYTPLAPRAGLEQRILASLAARDCRPRWWQWKSAWALAAGVLLLVSVAIFARLHSAQPQITIARREPVVQQQQPPQQRVAIASTELSTHRLRVSRSQAAKRQATQPQFGVPRVTREEQLLARLAAEEPELFADLSKEKHDPAAPITIAPITINAMAAKTVEIQPIEVAPIEIKSI